MAQQPDIPRPAGRHLGHARHVVGVGQARGGLGEQRGELVVAEADQAEIGPDLAQVGELDPEQRLVPAGIERELVVGQHVGALLRLRPAAGDHDGDLGQAQLAGGQHAPVAGNQHAALVHQHRHRPAPLAHTGRDLGDLRLAVRARVAGVGHEPLERPTLHLVRRPVLHDYPLCSIRGHESPTRRRFRAQDRRSFRTPWGAGALGAGIPGQAEAEAGPPSLDRCRSGRRRKRHRPARGRCRAPAAMRPTKPILLAMESTGQACREQVAPGTARTIQSCKTRLLAVR